ncbi:hypothetical protein ebA6027 [Aromatoleum aromaticum EbN1]|uniref:Uncharacterized protein n=1 Tax=Aromatoleum aromaticum (strain DSM 19018 / LMG 30748 / EbN1) TaxID=76114 RepID=Q5NZE9_AROAE|nr:hypothetical protein ebA6027 [Aromatoleum aromaticum EbN1]
MDRLNDGAQPVSVNICTLHQAHFTQQYSSLQIFRASYL